MTKTHNDLDAILQLLQEKEKDLELAANIGQSLLERNKNLMQKTEAMEQYLEKSFDKEDQLRHEIVMKNELLQKFLKDQEDLFYDQEHQTDDELRSSDSSCKDDTYGTLRDKCSLLEQHNSHLILEALKIKEDTASEEQKERQLVADCVRQMMDAKDHITALTDEISRKADDNVRQQDEISQLINTVVDLQKRHRQLSNDNEELQSLLSMSQASQDDLQSKVADLQDKYQECFEILMENQQEMKTINQKIETPHPVEAAGGPSLHDTKGSIALEIEESVKRDLAQIHEKRLNLARVLQTVRNINTPRGKKPKRKPSTVHSKCGTTVESGERFNFTPAPELTSTPSDLSLSSSDETASTGLDSRHSYGRRSFRKPEKLQIVKPMKGSATLHQWKKLASPTMNLDQSRPGVHVKGEVLAEPDTQHGDDSGDESDEDDQPIMMRSSQPRQDTPAPTPDTPTSSRAAPPRTLALTSLVSEQGISAGARRDSTSASILAKLLNSPSSTAPEHSSVGQVLAGILQRASEEASAKEPKRAESLRSLANYFSEKERTAGPVESTIPEDDSPPVSPPAVPLPPASLTGSIFSRILGSSSMNITVPPSRPVTTTANSTSSLTTTSAPLLGRPGFGRTASGSNLQGLINSNASFPGTDKRLSLDMSEVNVTAYLPNLYTDSTAGSMPTLRRRASSGDLETMASSAEQQPSVAGFGGRLMRSSSSGNLQDLSQMAQAQLTTDPGTSPDTSSGTGVGFFGRLRRRPSLGSLTDLIQRSNIGTAAVPITGQRASSLDSATAFQSSQSPPSPTRFDGSGTFFNPPTETASASIPAANTSSGFFGGSRLRSLAGVRGLWSQGPAPATSGGIQAPGPPAVARSEERLERINKAFALEDFGGMGLMSYFGGKTKGSSPPK